MATSNRPADPFLAATPQAHLELLPKRVAAAFAEVHAGGSANMLTPWWVTRGMKPLTKGLLQAAADELNRQRQAIYAAQQEVA